MTLPILSRADVVTLVPQASDVGRPARGGQKLVFPCEIDGSRAVLKFMLARKLDDDDDDPDVMTWAADEVLARAKREVGLLEKCDSPHLVKLGSLGFTKQLYRSQALVYFSEEFIDGGDLKGILEKQGSLDVLSLIRLAEHMCLAVEVLSDLNVTHRDLKPGNIMLRQQRGEFVLLDMGIAFDPGESPITAPGFVLGTTDYFSPEQIEFARTRLLDFRSDFFSLGIVLYEAATGRHPFRVQRSMTTNDVFTSILGLEPPPVSKIISGFPEDLDRVIMRLLAKSPHLRYRNCARLMSAIKELQARERR